MDRIKRALMGETPPGPSSAWDRVEAERQKNYRLNSKYFQPRYLPHDASPREIQKMHDWMRLLADQGLTEEQIQAEFWATKKP